MRFKNLSGYIKAKERLLNGGRLDPHTCMDFLDCIGYHVGALGNEEIIELTEFILSRLRRQAAERVSVSQKLRPSRTDGSHLFRQP